MFKNANWFVWLAVAVIGAAGCSSDDDPGDGPTNGTGGSGIPGGGGSPGSGGSLTGGSGPSTGGTPNAGGETGGTANACTTQGVTNCECKTFAGQEFAFCPPANWEVAKLQCENAGASLVTFDVNNPDANFGEFLEKSSQEYQDSLGVDRIGTWLGASRKEAIDGGYGGDTARLDADWFWVDGTTFSEDDIGVADGDFPEWGGGGPDASDDDENCLEMSYNGPLNDARCTKDDRVFICDLP